MQPGDIFLTTGSNFYSHCIMLGQTFKYPKSKYATWTHCGIIANTDGQTIEALAGGVISGYIGLYENNPLQYIQIDMSDADRMQVLAYAHRCIGRRYGWATIGSIGLSLAIGLRFSFGFDADMICSGLVANALCRADIDITLDPKNTLPADIAAYFNI